MHAGEDKKRRESVEIKNMAEAMVYTTEKMMKEHGEQAKPEDKKDVEEKLEALKKVKDGEDIEAIKQAADAVATAAQKIGAALYQDRPEAEAGAGTAPETDPQSSSDQPDASSETPPEPEQK